MIHLMSRKRCCFLQVTLAVYIVVSWRQPSRSRTLLLQWKHLDTLTVTELLQIPVKNVFITLIALCDMLQKFQHFVYYYNIQWRSHWAASAHGTPVCFCCQGPSFDLGLTCPVCGVPLTACLMLNWIFILVHMEIALVNNRGSVLFNCNNAVKINLLVMMFWPLTTS